MNRHLLILILIFISGCNINECEAPFKPDQQQRLANEVRQNVAMQLRKEKELIPCGFGAGMVPHIWMLALSFNYYEEVDIEKSRDLLISAGSLFLKSINENKEIIPYLNNFPFEPQNIEIRIFLYPKETYPGVLSVIALLNGKLEYEIDGSNGKGFETIYTETYEEALAKHTRKLSEIKL